MPEITFDAKVPSAERKFAGVAIVKWECPNCGQRLADVMGERVVIRVSDRRISIPLRDGTDQCCWRCGAYSELRLLQ